MHLTKHIQTYRHLTSNICNIYIRIFKNYIILDQIIHETILTFLIFTKLHMPNNLFNSKPGSKQAPQTWQICPFNKWAGSCWGWTLYLLASHAYKLIQEQVHQKHLHSPLEMGWKPDRYFNMTNQGCQNIN